MQVKGWNEADGYLAANPRERIILVRETIKDSKSDYLVALCSKCNYYIHFDQYIDIGVELMSDEQDVQWRCSNSEFHEKKWTRKGFESAIEREVEASIIGADSDPEMIQRWAAYWLNVPVEDVEVAVE